MKNAQRQIKRADISGRQRDSLKFEIGPDVYTLFIADRALFDEEGDELEGRAIEAPKVIVISFSVAPERRLEVAYHEYQHAWEFAVPAPRDAEERCDFASFLHRKFTQDLERQGGPERLMELIPQRVPHLGRPKSELAKIHEAHDLYVSAALGSIVTSHLNRSGDLEGFDFDGAARFAAKLSRKMAEAAEVQPIPAGYGPKANEQKGGAQ